jgi:hypothetical protein
MKSKSPEAKKDGRWEQGFAALSKFRARERHCVPSRYHMEGNYSLGPWVSTQRYLKDSLPLLRKRRLDAIGFIWDWRDHRWDEGFAALLKFKKREGHTCVPICHREGYLQTWPLGFHTAQKQKRNVSRTEGAAE